MVFFLVSSSFAGSPEPSEPEPYVSASYVIAASTKDYASAMVVAVRVAEGAKLPPEVASVVAEAM